MNVIRILTSQRRLGYTLAFGALISGGTYSALAKGLTGYLSPFSLLLVSEALTALFIIVTFGLVPLLKKLKTLPLSSLGIAALVGLLNSVIAPLFWFYGLSKTTAVNSAILSTSDVIFVLLLSYCILKERPSKMQVAGGLVVLSGVFVVNVASLNDSLGVNIGDFLILTAVASGALGAVLFKKYLSNIMPELAVAIRNITAIIIVACLSTFLDHAFIRELTEFPAEKVVLLLAFGFFSRYINLTCFYEALDRLPATTVSLLEIANPLFGMFFAVLLLDESLYTYHIVGAGLMVIGLVIEQMSETTLAKFKCKSLILKLSLRDKNPMTHLLTRITRHS